MILVFVFLTIIIALTAISLILVMSSIKIKIENLKIDCFKLNSNYKILIQLYFLNRIKYLSIKIDKSKINNILISNRFNKLKEINIPTNREIKFIIKGLNIELESLNLNIDIGLEEADVTSILVGTIGTIISLLTSKLTKNKDLISKIYYKVNPKYNKDIIIISLESIISIKIVHIIYVIYILEKKGRDKNGRTSDRRAYAYSHGFN